MGRPLLRAAWTQNAEPWEKAPGLRVSFLRKRLAKDFWSRLILLFSPEADVPAGNSSQLLQLTILACPSQALWPRVPVISASQPFGPALRSSPLVSFSIPLSLLAPVNFFGLALRSSPSSQLLCSSVLARLSQLFWSRAPVIPLVSFSIPLFLPALVSFFGLAFRSSPWSFSTFPSPSPP